MRATLVFCHPLRAGLAGGPRRPHFPAQKLSSNYPQAYGPGWTPGAAAGLGVTPAPGPIASRRFRPEPIRVRLTVPTHRTLRSRAARLREQ